jgi:acyl carrier protein
VVGRTLAETEARVIEIIMKASLGAANAVPVESQRDLRDELGLDSNVLMSIAFRLEKEFDVDITAHADELAALRTVGDVARFFHQVGAN